MAKASYRELDVWRMAMDVAVRVYRLTRQFPNEEKFGLTQQLRRAASSISSNIAEGYGRKTHKQTFHFLENALGSTFEVETQLELAARLGYVNESEEAVGLIQDIARIGKGINGLMQYIARDSYKAPRP